MATTEFYCNAIAEAVRKCADQDLLDLVLKLLTIGEGV